MPGRGRGLSELSERVGVSGQCGVNSSVCACRRLFNSSTCRISGDSSVRESTLIGCSGKQTSARKKTQKQRGNAPWVCGCSFHGYTHLAQLFLIFLPCLFTWASVTFYQTCSSVQSSYISESGFKRQQFVFLWRGICLRAVAARTRLLVASCRLRRVNRATFWPDSDGGNTTQQPIFVTAHCLLSVWCVGAFSYAAALLMCQFFSKVQQHHRRVAATAGIFICCSMSPAATLADYRVPQSQCSENLDFLSTGGTWRQ